MSDGPTAAGGGRVVTNASGLDALPLVARLRAMGVDPGTKKKIKDLKIIKRH